MLVIKLTRTERIRPTALLSDYLNVGNVVDMLCSTLNSASARTHCRCALYMRRAIRSVCHLQSILPAMTRSNLQPRGCPTNFRVDRSTAHRLCRYGRLKAT